jgi:2'-5' RNA ligase
MRCFISIEFPEHIRAQIFHAFENLKKSGTCYGNFVEKENLHLTLSFLGELSEEEIKKAEGILNKIDFRKFPVEMGKIGYFPNEDYVKVIWVGVNSREIANLREIIENKLRKEGFSIKEIDFVPHLTVARIKSIKNKKGFFEEIEKIKLDKMFFIAEDFSLMKSILKKEGPEYKVLERFGMRIRE